MMVEPIGVHLSASEGTTKHRFPVLCPLQPSPFHNLSGPPVPGAGACHASTDYEASACLLLAQVSRNSYNMVTAAPRADGLQTFEEISNRDHRTTGLRSGAGVPPIYTHPAAYPAQDHRVLALCAPCRPCPCGPSLVYPDASCLTDAPQTGS